MLIYIDIGEEWRPVYIDNAITTYSVSSYGRVMNTDTNKILAPRSHTSGYKQVSLYVDSKEYRFYIHRLVLMTFYPVEGYDELQVNHIDGVKDNNHLSNLEWCTNSENQIHAHRTGLKQDLYGDKKGKAKHTNAQILEMCDMMIHGVPSKVIRDKFNITDDDLLSDIRNKRRWSKVTKNYTFSSGVLYGENNPSCIYNDDDVHNICKCLERGISQIDIFNKYNGKYSKSLIWKIKNRKTRRNIVDSYKF